MSMLDEILSEFEGLTGVRKTTAIPQEKLKLWMQSPDMEVLGTVYTLICDKKCFPRIEPPLRFHDCVSFLMNYYERCLRENPDGEWSDSRYTAGADIVLWFSRLWKDDAVPRNILESIKNMLAKLYKEGNEDIRTCIITAILEHLFTNKSIVNNFADWKTDPILKDAYDVSLEYSKGFSNVFFGEII